MDETDRGVNTVYKKSEVFSLDVEPSVEVSLRKWKAKGLSEITQLLARLRMATDSSTELTRSRFDRSTPASLIVVPVEGHV